MNRLLSITLLLAVVMLCPSCRSNNQNTTNGQTNATPAADATPPPGTEEISEARYQKDIQQNPDDAVAHYNLANVYFAQSKFKEAAGEYQKVVERDPKDFDALGRLGMSYAGLNQYPEAIDAYKKALQINQKNGELHQLLGEAYAKAGQTKDAEQQQREAQRLQPNETAKQLLKDGKAQEALAETQKVFAKNAETYAVMGDAQFRLNQFEDALKSYRQSLRLDPKFPNAQFQIGNALDRLGRSDEAAKAFQEAARLNSQDADAYFNLGNAYDKLRRDKDAVAAYQQAVKLNPGDADARYALGLSLLKSGQRDAANEQADALKTLKPESSAKLQQFINQMPGTK